MTVLKHLFDFRKPSSSMAAAASDARSLHLIRRYFNYEIIASLASNHNIFISKHNLNRKLRELCLYCRKHHTDIVDVACFTEEQLSTSGQLCGYRRMHLIILQNGILVSRETVRHLMGLLDPEGVKQRRRWQLQRRQYNGTGPNFVWHLDSYDKLKPYGICINRCIDGYSRQILWLEASLTNSDPGVIAGYFMETVGDKVGCPRLLRGDAGT